MKTNVIAFGAKGDGFTDDYIAIQAAFDSGASVVTIPQGNYLISKTLKVPSHITILADRNAELVMKSSERKKRNDFLLTNNDPEMAIQTSQSWAAFGMETIKHPKMPNRIFWILPVILALFSILSMWNT